MADLFRIEAVTDRSGWTGKHRTSPFQAEWRTTLDLLGRELTYLRATNVVLELDVSTGDVRLDGKLRAGVTPYSPGVRLVFDTMKHGQLVYATDAFDAWGQHTGWKANLRAVALTMEQQRRIERYGVSAGRQYVGHKALPSGATPIPAPMTVEDAAAVVAAAARYDGLSTDLVTDAAVARSAYRRAALAAHPDSGGDVGRWLRIQQARDLLTKHHGGQLS